METKILKVVKCGGMTSAKSEKSETGLRDIRQLVLQELGGKYEPTYVVKVFDNLATLVFNEGDVVIASLRFETREYNGQTYMDIVAKDLIKVNK